MKKIIELCKITGISLASLMIVSFFAAAVSAADFSYSAASGVISIDIKDSEKKERYANISLLPINVRRSMLDASQLDKNKMMFDVIERSGSEFGREYDVKNAFDVGEYVLYADFEDKTNRFVLINCDDEKLDALLKILNEGGQPDNTADFGADSEIYDANGEIIEKLIKNQKKGDFTKDSFLRAYIRAEGTSRLCGGQISCGEFADLYGEWFDLDLSETDSWDDKGKTEFERAAKAEPIDSRVPENILYDALYLAKISNAKSSGDAEKILLEYLDENNLSYEEFSKLNDYYRSEAVSELTNSVKSSATMQQLYNSFTEISKKQYNKQKGLNEGGASSSGGGGGGRKIESPVSNADSDEKYSDLDSHWSRDYVNALVKKGYISGYPDKTFRPDNAITRAEMAKLACNILKLAEKKISVFDDVGESDWFYGCIGAAAEAGIICGDGKSFSPEENITRQDAAVIMMRILKYCGKELSGSKTFADSESVSEYAQQSVSCLAAQGIINGSEGLFNPKKSITRGEIAALAERATALIK